MQKIISLDESYNAWLDLGELNKITVTNNPLFFKDRFFDDHPGLWEIDKLKDADYLSYTCWLLLGIKLQPFQAVILHQLWTHYFPLFIACRGAGKTYLLAIYSLLRALFFPEYKVVIAGASFRQSKMVFDYIEQIWNNAPMFRSMCDSRSESRKDQDRWQFRINDSIITAIPIGPTGDKIRGLRANTVLVDEMAAHNPQILEEVIFGFMSVKQDPSEGVIQHRRKEFMGELVGKIGADSSLMTKNYKNQGIITGTADYYFNHFYDYWQRYKKIILSKGDPSKLKDVFQDDIPEAFDYRDYCIIRVPYSIVPKGFMDDGTIARQKANMSTSLFNKEYEAIFVEDSDGFYRRSLIESCVASEINIDRYGDKWAPWCSEPFHASTRGNPDGMYVFGIDPASEVDNFALVILEVHPQHQRCVYAWTTNRKNFQDRKKNRATRIDDYYHFCARKIRDLIKVFPCAGIGVDMGGGGIALCEALHDKDKIEEGESQIWLTIDDNKERDSDLYAGEHIIHPIQFANATWTSEANWGMLKDLQSKQLLFPCFDPITIEISIEQDKMRTKQFSNSNPGLSVTLYDSLEDCVLNIEDLKTELASIIHTRTGVNVNSREKWSVPEMVTENKKRVGGRKDRYSALLIANHVARTMNRTTNYTKNKDFLGIGGGIINRTPFKTGGPAYYGPDWFTNPK